MFITFEGIEGSGKTTQINFLHDFFKEKSIKAVFTKEPGSSKIGGEIRNLLLNKNLDLSTYAELFLIFADRSQHVEEIIKPKLSAGFTVVSIKTQEMKKVISLKNAVMFKNPEIFF